MSSDDDAFINWSREPAQGGGPQAPPPGRRPSRRRRWWSRYGTLNLVLFIVLVAAVLSLAASFAKIGPWASSTPTAPALRTSAPTGPTSSTATSAPTGVTSSTATTAPTGVTSSTVSQPGRVVAPLAPRSD